jgi:hypothetical protein
MDETSIEALVFKRVIGLLQELGPVIMSHLQTIGVLGELLVYQHLLKIKNDSIHIQYPTQDSSYDILFGDERIEVKTALQNDNESYCIIIRKNKDKFDHPLFDRLIVVLLESPMAKPVFIEIDQDSALNHTGFNSDLEGFKKRFKVLD